MHETSVNNNKLDRMLLLLNIYHH